MKTEKENITLVELKELESTSEKLGREIRMLSRGTKKLLSSSLKRETIVILLHESSKVPRPNIRLVLIALEELEKDYLRPEVLK